MFAPHEAAVRGGQAGATGRTPWGEPVRLAYPRAEAYRIVNTKLPLGHYADLVLFGRSTGEFRTTARRPSHLCVARSGWCGSNTILA